MPIDNQIEHVWTWDDYEYGENGEECYTSDLYCCKCFLERDWSKEEDQEDPCPGYYK